MDHCEDRVTSKYCRPKPHTPFHPVEKNSAEYEFLGQWGGLMISRHSRSCCHCQERLRQRKSPLMSRPFRSPIFFVSRFPGRCPGLVCIALFFLLAFCFIISEIWYLRRLSSLSSICRPHRLLCPLLKTAHEDKEDMISNRGHRGLCAEIKFFFLPSYG